MAFTEFSPEVTALLDSVAFAHLTTLMADGSPQSTVIWFRREGQTLRITCGTTSLKARNVRRDDRVAVSIEDPNNPYAYVQIRGRARVIESADEASGSEEFRLMANHYFGPEKGPQWYATSIESSTEDAYVVLEITPERVQHFSDSAA